MCVIECKMLQNLHKSSVSVYNTAATLTYMCLVTQGALHFQFITRGGNSQIQNCEIGYNSNKHLKLMNNIWATNCKQESEIK